MREQSEEENLKAAFAKLQATVMELIKDLVALDPDPKSAEGLLLEELVAAVQAYAGMKRDAQLQR